MKLKYEDQLDAVALDDSTSHGEKMLLYWLIRELKPTTVIETGTHRGATTFYMAHALMDNKHGALTTCDPYEWGAEAEAGNFPEFSKIITFKHCRGDELDVKDVDFAFIDGLHEYREVQKEVAHLFPRLSPRAVVVFHDCWGSESDLLDVNDALVPFDTIWLGTHNALRIYSQNDSLVKPK